MRTLPGRIVERIGALDKLRVMSSIWLQTKLRGGNVQAEKFGRQGMEQAGELSGNIEVICVVK